MVPYILPLIGLLFLVFGVTFVLRAYFEKSATISFQTRRRLGLIYLLAGAVLTALGIARLY